MTTTTTRRVEKKRKKNIQDKRERERERDEEIGHYKRKGKKNWNQRKGQQLKKKKGYLHRVKKRLFFLLGSPNPRGMVVDQID